MSEPTWNNNNYIETTTEAQLSTVEAFIQWLTHTDNLVQLTEIIPLYEQHLITDAQTLSELVTYVVHGFRNQDIQLSRARLITAELCKLVGEYVLYKPYQQEEEEELKNILKLLTVLVMGAVKTPLEIAERIPKVEPQCSIVENYTEQNLDGEREENHLHQQVEETDNLYSGIQSLNQLAKQDVYKYRENYGFVCFNVINLFWKNQPSISSEDLLALAVFYCSDNQKIHPKSLQRFEQWLNTITIPQTDIELQEGFLAIRKFGFREVLGLAEFQYRKNQYISGKSKFNSLGNTGTLDESYDDISPLEMIAQSMILFLKKLQDSLVSGISPKASNVNFNSNVENYFSQETGHSQEEQVMILFNTLNKICLDGLLRNNQAKEQIEQGIQFGKKAKDLFNEVQQKWIENLNKLTRLTISSKVVKTPNGQRFKKLVLDWPLSSFFMKYDGQQSRITQTINSEKIEQLPAEECASLLILLYWSIHQTQNPLGQVQNIYAALREKLFFNKQLQEYTENYLTERGFTPVQIGQMIKSKEIIETI